MRYRERDRKKIKPSIKRLVNMEKIMLLEVIGDTPGNKVIDFLIEGMGISYTKKDIAAGAGISRPTLYKIFPTLGKQGVIKAAGMVGRIKLYALNGENARVKALIALEGIMLRDSFPTEKIKVRV